MHNKKPPPRRGLSDSVDLNVWLFKGNRLTGSTDGRACRATGVDSAAASRGEVVSVALVHHFHAEAGTVQHIAQVFRTRP